MVALTESWLDSTISLVRQAWSQTSKPTDPYHQLATVGPCGDAPDWYAVQGRPTPGQRDFITEGNLTYDSGGQTIAFDVLEVIIVGEQVRVRASKSAPRVRLSLRVRAAGTRQILEGLGRGLAASRANPLLTQFGERKLTPVERDPRLTQVHGWQALRGAQKDAVAACCSGGIQLVDNAEQVRLRHNRRGSRRPAAASGSRGGTRQDRRRH